MEKTDTERTMAVNDFKIDALMKDLALKSIGVLSDFLSNPTEAKDKVLAVKAAQVSLSNYTRHEQTQGARDATTFMMARELAQNPDELAHYMKVAMPSSQVTKAIPQKTITA